MDIEIVKQLKLYELLHIFKHNRATNLTDDWILFSNYNHRSRADLRNRLIDIVIKGVFVSYPVYVSNRTDGYPIASNSVQ